MPSPYLAFPALHFEVMLVDYYYLIPTIKVDYTIPSIAWATQ